MKADGASEKSRSNMNRTRSSRTFVPNSSDGDEGTIEVRPLAQPPAPIRRVLKEVAIPAMGSRRKAAAAQQQLSTANISKAESSAGSPSLDNSDYETPGTSISTTPATSIRRGARSTRKSGLSDAVAASLTASSSRKRSRAAVRDTDDGADDIDMDAELAVQMQMEEEAQERKRQKTAYEDLTVLDSDEDDLPLARKRAPTYKGKGKGKAKVEDAIILESDDDVYSAPSMATPVYKGKGKGKAKAEDPPSSRARSARSRSKLKTMFVVDDGLSEEDLDDEDEFKLEDDDEDDLADDGGDVITLKSDSEDDEPLMLLSKRAQASTSRAAKPARGKKTKTLTLREKAERRRRIARFAHIEDQWERKRAMNRERAEQAHPKLLTMWNDLEAIPVLEVQRAEQPDSITRRLKPFQLEGLSWMIRQEKTGYNGGLLGDEMGMGKTIQAVSLIMSDYPAKAPTLVVVPPVALMQWSNEIKEYTDGKLKVLVYHGTNAKCKKMTVKDLKKFDVIMVSYNSLESLHRKETKGWNRGEDIIKEASPLHAIHYHRLILDEAHSIKSRTTGVAKACFALKGTYKWCLSGTPVQNRIGEFFSLLRFLEVRPFADYFCRSCGCEQLHWTVDEDHMCKACDHGASEHISVFNQELLNPITGDDPELREEALTKLHMITARIMLRRMKRDHTNSMVISPKSFSHLRANLA